MGTLQQSDGLLVNEAGDELLKMSVELGCYFNRNTESRRVCAVLDKPRTLQEMASLLLSEYEANAETLNEELRTFLIAMNQRELLVVSDVKTD